MKKDIHPSNYREVAFKDMSNEEVFITRSTVNTKETIEIDGTTYPLVKLEITNTSHPFFTGKQKLVDTAGRVDKFMQNTAAHLHQRGCVACYCYNVSSMKKVLILNSSAMGLCHNTPRDF